MIFSVIKKGDVTYSTCMKWYQRFRNTFFNFADEERPGTQKKYIKTRDWTNCCKKILVKHKRSLLTNLESPNRRFLIS